MVLGQDRVVLVSTWSVGGGTGWFLVILGQYGAVLDGTWCYWVSRRRYCLETDIQIVTWKAFAILAMFSS